MKKKEIKLLFFWYPKSEWPGEQFMSPEWQLLRKRQWQLLSPLGSRINLLLFSLFHLHHWSSTHTSQWSEWIDWMTEKNSNQNVLLKPQWLQNASAAKQDRIAKLASLLDSYLQCLITKPPCMSRPILTGVCGKSRADDSPLLMSCGVLLARAKGSSSFSFFPPRESYPSSLDPVDYAPISTMSTWSTPTHLSASLSWMLPSIAANEPLCAS